MPVLRWWPAWGRTALFALAGATLALALAARVDATIGPFECTVVARPSLQGTTLVRLAPLGSIELDTHTGPVAVELRVDELRPEDAGRIAADPSSLEGIEDELAEDARAALVALARQALLAGTLGGIAGALVARVHWRAAVTGLLTGTLLVGAVGGAAAASFEPRAVAEPRYSGLLTIAPRAVGDVSAVVERFDDYRAQLSELVANVTGLYRAAEALPDLAAGTDDVRVLHVSDIHNNPQGYDLVDQIVDQFDVSAVVDTGDATDWGTTMENRLLDRIERVGVPYVWVRGNHDSRRTQAAVAARPNTVVLDGDVAEVNDLAATEPARLEQLQAEWWRQAEANHVLPLDDRFAERFAENAERHRAGRTHYELWAGLGHVPTDAAPDLRSRSYTITVEVLEPGAGVLVAHGDETSGYSLWVDAERHVVHDLNVGGNHDVLRSARPLPDGPCTVAFRLERGEVFLGRAPGTATLSIDGEACGSLETDRIFVVTISWSGLDVGRDRGSPVGAYAAPNEFTGRIRRVVFDLDDDQDLDHRAVGEAESARE